MGQRVTEGSGSVNTSVAPAAACAYLADPRHAGEWFARVAEDSLPAGPPREGLRWQLREGAQGKREKRRTVELVRLDCPRTFAWQTRLPLPRTNIRWELEVAPAAEGGSTLTLTTRWLPGPLGWPLVLLLALAQPEALSQRSQRTVERARDALEAAPSPTSGRAGAPPGRAAPPRARRRGRRR